MNVFRPADARILSLSVAMLLAGAAVASACPFCTVESQTLSEEIESADAAILARLVREAATDDTVSDDLGTSSIQSGSATFEIVEVLRGHDSLTSGEQIQAVYYGEPDRERLFLITGINFEGLEWTLPLPLSSAAVEFIRQLPSVAPSGPDRLAFFQEYFEHEDPLLAQDAYEEFARASYDDVKALRERMHHDRLIEWIVDPEVSPSRRRLYFTLLGVCGDERDLPLLEELINSDYEDLRPFVETMVYSGVKLGGPLGLPTWIELVKQDERRKKMGLDSMIACYLVLRGGDGLDLIDERFLKNPKAEYTHVYSTIMALRFHGDEETRFVPTERLLASTRLLLDHPDFADQVIPDLARWDDWAVLDRLVEMFKSSDEHGFVRQPVVTYLTVASEQPDEVGERATAALEELERLDPESVKRARSLMAFGLLARARPAGDPSAGGAEDTTRVASDEDFAMELDAVENETPGTDLPDPADYVQHEAAAGWATDTQLPEADATDGHIAIDGVVVTDDATPNEVEPTADSAGATMDEPSRWLIVGLPLAAVAVLIVVYWLILRTGAM